MRALQGNVETCNHKTQDVEWHSGFLSTEFLLFLFFCCCTGNGEYVCIGKSPLFLLNTPLIWLKPDSNTDSHHHCETLWQSSFPQPLSLRSRTVSGSARAFRSYCRQKWNVNVFLRSRSGGVRGRPPRGIPLIRAVALTWDGKKINPA